MDGRSPRSKGTRVGLRLAVAAAAVVAAAGTLSTVGVGGIGPDLIGVVGVLCYTFVGAIILDRRPGEPVGRICLGIGLLYGVAATLRLVAVFGDGLGGRLPPAFAAVAVLSSFFATLALVLSGPLLISRFPYRAETRWQRRLEDLLMGVLALIVLGGALRSGPIQAGPIEAVPNPLGLGWIPGDPDTTLMLTIVLYGAASVITTLGLIFRYRKGGSIVRAQIRWFAAAIVASLALLIITALSPGNDTVNAIAWSAWIASLILPPIAIAIAILRYRLYDIDRIVSNAIGYGIVTVVLSAIFVTVNLLLVAVLSQIVVGLAGNGIAVAAATLVAAALFTPVRHRVQRAVDHRFHRARYDAERTVVAFATRLRDEVDVNRLRQDILDVVIRSVEPTGVELWLRRDMPR